MKLEQGFDRIVQMLQGFHAGDDVELPARESGGSNIGRNAKQIIPRRHAVQFIKVDVSANDNPRVFRQISRACSEMPPAHI